MNCREVDTHTGYRIYEAHQLPRLHRIVVLKDLGFTLEQHDRLKLARVSDDHAAWQGVSPAGKLFPGPLAPMT